MVAQREVHPAHVHDLELAPIVIVKGDGAVAGNARPLCEIHGTFVTSLDPGSQARMLAWPP